jgi:hypothetical protein
MKPITPKQLGIIVAAIALGVLAFIGDKRPPLASPQEVLATAYVYDGMCARVPGLIAMMHDDPAVPDTNSPAFQRARDKAIEQYAANPRGFCLAVKPGIDRAIAASN